MIRKKISDVNSSQFKDAFAIYEASFPKEERRSWEQQLTILNDKQYHFEVIIEENVCFGIFCWWKIENYRFIEHFAIDPTLRSTGIGKKIITDFLVESKIPVVLEVEKPEDELTKRRIEFYKRQGFLFADFEYAQPPFILNTPFVALRLMTFPIDFTKEDVSRFIEVTHPIVHRHYYEGLKK